VQSNQPQEMSAWQVFKEVVETRSHWKEFDPDCRLDQDLIEDIVATAQRAPSSFNSQPYKVILVREAEQKLALSQAMLTDSNKRVVLESDTSAVFLADLQMVAAIPKVQQLWRDTTNAPDDYINKHMAKGLTVQSAGFTGWLAPLWRFVTCLFLTILGFFKLVPDYNPPPCWSYRQVGFLADHFLLAATAAGLKTAVLEGFSGEEVRRQLKVPPRYRVFCTISIGKPRPGATGKSRSSRFSKEEVFLYNTFDNKRA